MTERGETVYIAMQNAIEAAIRTTAAKCGGDIVSLHNEISAAIIDVLAYHCIAMGCATTPEDASINADLVKARFIDRIDFIRGKPRGDGGDIN